MFLYGSMSALSKQFGHEHYESNVAEGAETVRFTLVQRLYRFGIMLHLFMLHRIIGVSNDVAQYRVSHWWWRLETEDDEPPRKYNSKIYRRCIHGLCVDIPHREYRTETSPALPQYATIQQVIMIM